MTDNKMITVNMEDIEADFEELERLREKKEQLINLHQRYLDQELQLAKWIKRYRSSYYTFLICIVMCVASAGYSAYRTWTLECPQAEVTNDK